MRLICYDEFKDYIDSLDPGEKPVLRGDVKLTFRMDLISLPENLTIHGSLFLDNCRHLERLPANLIVHGKISLSECINLRVIPDDVSAVSLYMHGCTTITTLPIFKNSVGGVLVNNCKNFSYLPDGFSVNMSLEARDCVSLKFLPERLKVGGILDISGTQINIVPNSAQIGGIIHTAPHQVLLVPDPSFITQDGNRSLTIFRDAIERHTDESLSESILRIAETKTKTVGQQSDCYRLAADVALSEDVTNFARIALTTKSPENSKILLAYSRTLHKKFAATNSHITQPKAIKRI